MTGATGVSPAAGRIVASPEVERELVAELAALLGTPGVVADADLRARYERDWMGRGLGQAAAVALPRSTEEVAAVLRCCQRRRVRVVPQGGNTGLVGGGVPRGGEVVVSTQHLGELAVDPEARLASVGAGVTLSALRKAATLHGLDVPSDLASRDSATLGGMVSTNAGGLRVIRYGHMRAQLRGLEAVLPSGAVVTRMAGLAKDTGGYDLTQLLCGAEGTLGVVTRVLVRLVPRARARVTALVGVGSLAEAVELVAHAGRSVGGLESAEAVFADGVHLVGELLGVRSPIGAGWPCQLVLEFAEAATGAGELAERVAGALERSGRAGASAVALEAAGRAELWAVRERHPEVVGRLGRAHKMDVSVPAGRLPTLEREVRGRLAAALPAATVVLYGHVGDGSLHVNVATSPGDDAPEDLVFELVRRHGGSISAEHGIGVDKPRWLSYTRSEAEIAAMWAVKQALDPQELLNPGVIFDGWPPARPSLPPGRPV